MRLLLRYQIQVNNITIDIMKKLICAALSLYSLLTFAQEPMRVEIPAKVNSDDYNIVPLGKEGVLLFSESDERSKKGIKTWNFTKYDTDFKEVWNKQFPIKNGLEFCKFDSNDDNLYLLFSNKKTSSSGITVGSDFEVIKMDVKSGDFDDLVGKSPRRYVLANFKGMGDNVFFGGKALPPTAKSMRNMCVAYSSCILFPIALITVPLCWYSSTFDLYSQAIYFHGDFGKKTCVPEMPKYKGSSEVTDIDVDLSKKMASIGFINRPDQKSFSMTMKVYDTSGEESGSTKIASKKELLTGRLMSLIGSEEKLIIGTYTKPTDKKGFSEKFKFKLKGDFSTGNSAGIYVSKINNGSQVYIQYYPYSQFTNMWEHIGPRASKKADAKAKKNNVEGKDVVSNYSFLIHNIVEKNGEYILIAEAYYPEYHTESRTTFDSKGMPHTTYVKVFDGYRYTNALVAGFSKAGELLWNNNIVMSEIISFDLRERLKVLPQGDNTLLVYSYGGMIKTKIINGREIVEGKTATPIQTGSENDKVKTDVSSDLGYWYDNYFVAWGYQRIKNVKDKDKNGGRKRSVFYFNKIPFE